MPAVDEEIVKEEEVGAEETPGAPFASTGKVTGLTGELAMQTMGRRAKKKLSDQMKKKEEEDKLLKDRIIAAKLE